jgi:methionyl aminopeptidase
MAISSSESEIKAQSERNCSSKGCSNTAKMQCPTCSKLNLDPSFFCSQSCFKDNWKDHKEKHVVESDNPWPSYRYTGNLRPLYPLSKTRFVPDHIRLPDYALDGIPRSEITVRGRSVIKQLSEIEIEKMRTVCRMAREVLDSAAKSVAVGVTTDEIDRIVHEEIIKRNAYPSPLNYRNFPKSCCTSVNEVICHGIPDRRPLQDGDIVNIDVTLYYDGFHGDLNETYLVGNVDEAGRNLVESSRECLMKAIEICKPGVRYREVGNIIDNIAKKNGHSVVKTYCGHGIHELFHCAPNVPHYKNNKAIGTMKPGHTFTIEPMISEGSWQDEHWPDDWTAVTIDGKRSAQFEHTLLITETGVEILT